MEERGRSARSLWDEILVVLLVVGGTVVAVGLFLLVVVAVPVFGFAFLAGLSASTTVMP